MEDVLYISHSAVLSAPQQSERTEHGVADRVNWRSVERCSFFVEEYFQPQWENLTHVESAESVHGGLA